MHLSRSQLRRLVETFVAEADAQGEQYAQDYELRAAREGYPFACSCGEMFRSADAAWNCKKCRSYLSDESQRSRKVYEVDPEFATVKEVPRTW